MPKPAPRAAPDRGTVSYQFLIILVPVVFGLMGFAVDLGQLYLVKGELKTAANAMALAAGARLIGTDLATSEALVAAQLTYETSTGYGNKYNFSGLPLNQTTGALTSEVTDPSFFQTVADALAGDDTAGSEVGGASARYVKVTVMGEAPLTFWSFLPLANERKVPVRMQAVAGISAPLCQACGIEPMAIAALDPAETVDFGLVRGGLYTLGYLCTGGGTPGAITDTLQRIEFLLLNHYDDSSTVLPDENQQLLRVGAGGLIPSATSTRACVSMSPNAPETMWVSAAPQSCGQVSSMVTSFACGLSARFDTSQAPSVCPNIPEIDTILSAFQQDSDLSVVADYAAYAGNGRRVITVAVVETLSAADPMVILGFRQFLIEPWRDTTSMNPADPNVRFAALYIGSPMPLKQGRLDGCTTPQVAGPGKVVLFQ